MQAQRTAYIDDGSKLRSEIEAEALALGFADCGVAAPEAVVEAGRRLRRAVSDGHHGEMAWMEDRIDWRADPRVLWPEVRSVIMLAERYTPEEDPLATLDQRDRATISVYARQRDYHDLVKKRLKRVARWLIAEAGGAVKVFVDTAPVAEKPLAQAAGLGWQGKHTNLLSRDLGNWFFLGAIFTTLEIDPDPAEIDHCGSCRACLDICPTDAFPAPYQLDARRCISYLTIEHKGPVDEALRAQMGNRIYGCDDCLAVCPWNKFAQQAHAAREFLPRAELVAPRLAELLALDDAGFRALFSGSPIKRIGRNRFVRNCLYAAGNSEDAALKEPVRMLVDDPDPVVAEAAQWALNRL